MAPMATAPMPIDTRALQPELIQAAPQNGGPRPDHDKTRVFAHNRYVELII